LKAIPDLLVGATAGQANSGTHTIIPLCHMPTKRTELLRTDTNLSSKKRFSSGMAGTPGNAGNPPA
jgi:hypothetical protein